MLEKWSGSSVEIGENNKIVIISKREKKNEKGREKVKQKRETEKGRNIMYVIGVFSVFNSCSSE